MDQVTIIHHSNVLYDLFAFMMVGLGYFFKGVVFAMLGETIYKPTAHYILRKGDEWEKTHPFLLGRIYHFVDLHKGLRPSICQDGRCQRLN